MALYTLSFLQAMHIILSELEAVLHVLMSYLCCQGYIEGTLGGGIRDQILKQYVSMWIPGETLVPDRKGEKKDSWTSQTTVQLSIH